MPDVAKNLVATGLTGVVHVPSSSAFRRCAPPRFLGAAALACLVAGSPGARAADLSPVETTWLKGAWPVIGWAKEAQLPLDLVVQPQDSPGAAPLSLAFVEGRCKLVLSMRGNPEAQAQLDRLPAGLQGPALELMAAHELAHCRRYLDGAWTRLPAGFSSAPAPDVLAPDEKTAWLEMKAQRREEGYADLVGLAWTKAHHPAAYAPLRAWLEKERDTDRIPGSHHDTLAWVRLVPRGDEFGGGGLFDGAMALWSAGLAQPE